LFGEPPAAVCEATAPDPCLSLCRRLISLAEECGIDAGLPSLSRLERFVEQGQEPVSKSEQERLAQDLVDSIASVSRHARLLVVIEDIDRTARRLTTFLEWMAQQARDVELSVVATTRASGLSVRTTNLLRVCLSESFVQVVCDLLPTIETHRISAFLSMDPDHRARAEQRAGGNPGFLELFCKSPSPTALPKQVRQVLSGLITRLPTQTKRVAEVLSLFDEPTSWNVLAGVSEVAEDELRGAVHELEHLGLVSSEGYSIRYPDARTLLHSRIPRARRTELHARSYRFLQEAGCKESILAYHAFEGALFGVASGLYRQLADRSFAERDYTRAGNFFCLVSDCYAREPVARSLDPEACIKLAKCHAYQSNKTQAQAILKKLLESKEVCGDSELVTSIYSTLASPLIEDSPWERVRLLRAAIESASQDSSRMFGLYGPLTDALLSLGRFTEAEAALDRLEANVGSEEDLQHLEGIRGLVMMNKGMFKEAVQCLSTKPTFRSYPGSVSNNLAVCIEQLGDIYRARDIQRNALREAESSGLLIANIISLTNLGAMETKLGNIGPAAALFDTARTKLRALQRLGAGTKVNLPSSFADMASLSIEKGNFRNAAACLNSIDLRTAGSFFPAELFLVAMTRCDLHLALEQREAATTLLNDARRLPLGGDYFEVDRLLVQERLEESSAELCSRLEHSLSVCDRLGTIYQSCRVCIALARHLVELGNEERANVLAEKAKEVSISRGYKPLAAKAMLLVGLSSKRDDHRDSVLRAGMDEAAELGFAPLVAEFAFWIGKLRFTRNDRAGAQEYLSKSISITARLADDLNSADRKTFLSKKSYREARDLFDQASTRTTPFPSQMTDVLDREGSLFARVYRLAAAMAAASDLNAAMTMLLQALSETLNYSIAVISGMGPKVTYYPIRLTISDETRRRILSVASAGYKPYIAGHGAGKHGTVIWMPILSLGLPGGIYVESGPGNVCFSERDIEFLTVVAAVSGAAFDGLSSKPGMPSPISSVDLYGIVGNSRQIGTVRSCIEIAARNAASVLIEGESGTGKELVARAIHRESSRAKGPFVAVDCGALPEGLIEAELFGAKRGAYTGAVSDRQGLFDAASQGTIFLDEIANLGITAQAKLLRVLQEREIRMVGSITRKTIDVRLIAATNCNLERLVRDGKFRQDLLYRLKVLHILIPPLRDRKEDIPVLATTFLERLNSSNQLKKYFSPRVMERFTQHNFPGNVRELQNAVERTFYMSMGAVINNVDFFKESSSIDSPVPSETENWFRDLTEGRENFWSDVHDRYKRRDISRERVVALVDFGLRTTRGRYKKMASMFQIRREEYHRFMDFLRRSQCLLDFRPYRKSDNATD
jgi:DNA-binding NtrC family response regulator/tetratricopeptide (TPR) repeat protein